MKILQALITRTRCMIQHHHPITPSGLAEAKDNAYLAGYGYWRKFQADICEYCYEGLIVVPKRKK